MSELTWRIGIISFIILCTVNLLWLDWQFIQDKGQLSAIDDRLNQIVAVLEIIEVAPNPGSETTAECGTACQKQVANLVDIQVAELLTDNNKTSSTTVVNRTTVPKGLQYIPVGSNGSTKSLTWVDIPSTETTIDWTTYGLNYTVTWDALLHVHQGNGSVTVRLYDTTAQAVVPGSEITTTSQDDVRVTSGKLTVPNDTHSYIVQIKSLSSYEAFYRDGRILVDIQ